MTRDVTTLPPIRRPPDREAGRDALASIQAAILRDIEKRRDA